MVLERGIQNDFNLRNVSASNVSQNCVFQFVSDISKTQQMFEKKFPQVNLIDIKLSIFI